MSLIRERFNNLNWFDIKRNVQRKINIIKSKNIKSVYSPNRYKRINVNKFSLFIYEKIVISLSSAENWGSLREW